MFVVGRLINRVDSRLFILFGFLLTAVSMWQMTQFSLHMGPEPVVALAAAAMVTTNLRLTGYLFDNDFRHPVVLAMSANSIDVLSEGRLELGIGAGLHSNDTILTTPLHLSTGNVSPGSKRAKQ